MGKDGSRLWHHLAVSLTRLLSLIHGFLPTVGFFLNDDATILRKHRDRLIDQTSVLPEVSIKIPDLIAISSLDLSWR